ncbi:MAG: hypothetical protein KA764_21110 [Anaerolineales bacterium]|nr:hypothetical protein [Anaerolineales bacterium]
MHPPKTSRPWPILVGGYLLAAQGAALIGTGLALLELAAPAAGGRAMLETRPAPLAGGVVCLILGALALANVVRFWRRRPDAWITAMLLQGLSLTLALLLYSRGHRAYSYPVMLAGVLMVLHLQRGDVVGPLRARGGPELPPPHREADHDE